MANRDTGGRAQVGTLEVGGVRVLRRQLQVPINTAPTAETDSGLDLPAKALVHDVYLDVTVAVTSGTATLDVGLLSTEGGGDADGFAVDLSTSGVRTVRPGVTSSTSGSLGRFLTANSYGALLSVFSSGSTAVGESGMFVRQSYVVNSTDARSISYSPGSTDWATGFRATIVVDFSEVTT